MPRNDIFTFGHSILGEEDAGRLLREAGVQTIVDIRSHPTSHLERWQNDRLRVWLPKQGIRYFWMPELGGWIEDVVELLNPAQRQFYLEHDVDLDAYCYGAFPKQRISKRRGRPTTQPTLTKSTWDNYGLWDYQWFMTTNVYREGIEELLRMADEQTIAIMCAELLWWKCHRSMVADCLDFISSDVCPTHLQPKRTYHQATDRLERYDPEVIKTWHSWWSG